MRRDDNIRAGDNDDDSGASESQDWIRWRSRAWRRRRMKSALFFPPQLLFSLTMAPLAAATNHCTDVDIRRAIAASALGSLFSNTTEDDGEGI